MGFELHLSYTLFYWGGIPNASQPTKNPASMAGVWLLFGYQRISSLTLLTNLA